VNAASLAAVLEEDALKLYTLIWARTMACQLEQATKIFQFVLKRED
jgi:DNA topoisomerase IA